MYIVMIASECAPVAKVGGLADVVAGLSRELQMRGHAVEIILPKYDCMRDERIDDLQVTYQDLWVPWFHHVIRTTVYFGYVNGLKCFFIDPHSSENLFNRQVFYGHRDDDLRFAFLCRASLEFMLKSGKHPDVIHCHDWQTGLVPVLLYEVYEHQGMTHSRVCYTLHNTRHQGVTWEHVLRATGLHRLDHFGHYDRLRDNFNPTAINTMKGGIVYSNFVTTVSPTHAFEIRHTAENNGLGHTLHIHQGKFGGILNGIDYDVWNPEIDPLIPTRYGIDTLEGKYDNKRVLRDRFWLRRDYKPIVAYVGRLDQQKGVNLIEHAVHYALSNGCQFVLLGAAADDRIGRQFWDLKRRYNDNPDAHIELGFNEDLAHLIYAGADIIIVPSRFEPCGLTQLIALKYGTVPVVRRTGGLADTVFDANDAHRPYHERNGYVFNDFNNQGIESALHRAIGLWYSYPQLFRELMVNGMRFDFSWNNPASHYLDVYDYIRDR
jgi:starch synthase